MVEAGARERGDSAEERLLAIFDIFHDWFQQEDYEGCAFINVLLETRDRDHPVGRASARYLANIRTVVRTLAEEAGLRDPDAFALSWHLLMKGAIVQAAEGDRQAAQRAKSIARSSSTNTANQWFKSARPGQTGLTTGVRAGGRCSFLPVSGRRGQREDGGESSATRSTRRGNTWQQPKPLSGGA